MLVKIRFSGGVCFRRSDSINGTLGLKQTKLKDVFVYFGHTLSIELKQNARYSLGQVAELG